MTTDKEATHRLDQADPRRRRDAVPAIRRAWARDTTLALTCVISVAAIVVALLISAVGADQDSAAASSAPAGNETSAAQAPPPQPGASTGSTGSTSRTTSPVPGTAGQPEVATDTPVPTQVARSHEVSEGETLAGIAQRYGVPVELIAADNALDPDRIAIGQELSISVPPTDIIVITEGATLSGYATEHRTTVIALVNLNPQITDPDHIDAGHGLRITAQ